MKRKDLTIVVAVAFVTAIISIIISGVIFGSPKKNPIKVPVVTPISSNFPVPQTDENYTSFFNKDAIDPTTVIQIGNSQNNNPFQSSNQ